MSEWNEYRISDLCDVRRGASPRPIQNYLSPVGMPWVKIADATASNSRFINSTNERIKLEGVEKSLTVHIGDLILSNSATPGMPKFMNIDACIHDGWILLRNFKHTTKEFLYYVLINERPRLVGQSNGSVFNNLKTDIVKNFKVTIPDLETQGQIIELLSSLDEKIELNNLIHRDLEELIQLLFKQWFIEFEFPNDQNLPYMSNGGEMVDTAQGPIPKQWTNKCLYEYATYINGAAYKDIHFGPKGLPIVKIVELKNGITPQTKFTNLNLGDKYEINTGDILFSWSGSPETSIDTFIWPLGKAWLNQHIFKVVSGSQQERSFIYSMLKFWKPRFISIAKNKQTTGLGHVTIKDLKEQFQPCPPQHLLHQYSEISVPVIDKILTLQQERNELIALRNLLLPKLLSGQLQNGADIKQKSAWR